MFDISKGSCRWASLGLKNFSVSATDAMPLAARSFARNGDKLADCSSVMATS
jgi:hypothetical protein